MRRWPNGPGTPAAYFTHPFVYFRRGGWDNRRAPTFFPLSRDRSFPPSVSLPWASRCRSRGACVRSSRESADRVPQRSCAYVAGSNHLCRCFSTSVLMSCSRAMYTEIASFHNERKRFSGRYVHVTKTKQLITATSYTLKK